MELELFARRTRHAFSGFISGCQWNSVGSVDTQWGSHWWGGGGPNALCLNVMPQL